jgi:dihydropteroate synthase
MGYETLVGISRKSMIYKVLHCTPQEALNGTTVLHTLAVQQKADWLRVHDVKEAVEVVRILETIKNI